MEGRHVDVTVISAEDLKKVTLIGKMRAYATVWIDPNCRQSTAVDEAGGTSPAWNQRLSFPVPEHFFQQPYLQLTVEIYSKSACFGDTFVGAASIPVSELAQKAAGYESTHEVRRQSSKVKGSLRLATRVGEKTTIAAAVPPAPQPYPYSYEQRPFEQPYPYPPPPATMPYGYPPPGGEAYGQGYYQQQPPPYYQAPPPPLPSQQRPGAGGMAMGLGAGLLAGAAGGLLAGEMLGWWRVGLLKPTLFWSYPFLSWKRL